MMRYLQFFLWIVFPLFASSSTIKYPVSLIPKNLFNNADAVIRKYTVEKEISPNNVVTQETFVITILNKNAEEQGYFVEFYDKQSKINDYKINLYNAAGLKINASKRSEFIDVKAFDGYTLFDDNRVVFNRAYSDNYPYTIEYFFTRKEHQTLIIPSWQPVNYRVAIENAELNVVVDDSVTFRYQQQNLDFTPVITENKRNTLYHWEIKNLEAIDDEPFMPYSRYVFPHVDMAVDKFSYDGYKGDLTSWKDFGTWVWNLTQGRDELPASTVNKLNELTANAKTEEEKIKILYQYLQDNTRYISIQLGIGGFQPFDAEIVDKTKYGDCKALTNYMKALLKSVGIPSIYTIVKAGRNAPDLELDFPSQQMNHVILCVPQPTDTIWLECTDQRIPFGYLGSFTDDRHVLLITENGGEIVKTPDYSLKQNQQDRFAKGTLDADGHLNLIDHTEYKALQYENIAKYFYMGPKDQKESLYKDLNTPNSTIQNFSFSLENQPIPLAKCDLTLDINNYASKSGNRLLVPVNPLNKQNLLLKKITDRKYPIVLKTDYVDSDTIEYQLPEGFTIEFLPDSVNLKSPFGHYSSGTIQTDSTLIYYRNVTVNKGTFAAESYEEIREFYQKMVKLDEQKMILNKKN